MPVVMTCAWHDALAVKLSGNAKKTHPAVTGRKGNANKARALPEMVGLEEA